MKRRNIVYRPDGVTEFDKYFDHIDAIKGRMPPALAEFSSDRTRYTLDGQRTLHDAWLEAVSVEVEYAENSNLIVSKGVTLKLIGASGSHFELSYSGVLNFVYSDKREKWPNSASDLLTHEFDLAPDGAYLHLLNFDAGVFIEVVFKHFRIQEALSGESIS